MANTKIYLKTDGNCDIVNCIMNNGYDWKNWGKCLSLVTNNDYKDENGHVVNCPFCKYDEKDYNGISEEEYNRRFKGVKK